jgi:hypothetical protein
MWMPSFVERRSSVFLNNPQQASLHSAAIRQSEEEARRLGGSPVRSGCGVAIAGGKLWNGRIRCRGPCPKSSRADRADFGVAITSSLPQGLSLVLCHSATNTANAVRPGIRLYASSTGNNNLARYGFVRNGTRVIRLLRIK